jgi:hypothetical protein
MTKINVRNLPDYAKRYMFIVSRLCDGELWFWGAYETKERANEVAKEIGGVVTLNF